MSYLFVSRGPSYLQCRAAPRFPFGKWATRACSVSFFIFLAMRKQIADLALMPKLIMLSTLLHSEDYTCKRNEIPSTQNCNRAWLYGEVPLG